MLRRRTGSALAILGAVRQPHLGFVIALLLVGPLFAVAGLSASGVWQPLGLGTGAMVVALTSARSAMSSYRDRTTWYPIRWRMTTTTAMVTVVAFGLSIVSVVWLLRVLTS